MKKILFSTVLMLFFIASFCQYNPSLHTVSNKSYGMAQAGPTDARSFFFDQTLFVYRPYQNIAEVKSYLNLAKYRTGNFIIVVDSGGVLQINGTYVGGHNTFWMFKDSTADANLVELNLLGSSAPCSGCLLASNNLNDLSNVGLARSNLGLGSMSQQNIAAGGTNLSGNWPDPVVLLLNGQPSSFYLNYNNLSNKPPQLNPTGAGLVSITGVYPNLTFTGNIPTFEQTIFKNNATSRTDSVNLGSFIFRFFGTSALGIPTGNTAQRPGSPATGDTRYNTDSLAIETWNGSIWTHPTGGGGGSGITALTGDGTASGTGSVPFTLSTVNSNVFGSNTFLKFSVNAKGLTTSATAVVSGDITDALGYIPYNSTNPNGYIPLTALSVTNSGPQGNATYNNTTGVFNIPNYGADTVNSVTGLTTLYQNSLKLSNTLTSSHIFVGNGSNVATDVAVSGDGTLSNTGVLTITKRDSLFGRDDITALQNRDFNANNHQVNIDSSSFFGLTTKFNANNQGTFAFQPNQAVLRTIGGGGTTVSEVGTFSNNAFGDGTTNGINLRIDNGVKSSRLNVSERYINLITDSIKFSRWGGGTHTGTVAFIIGEDASGNLLETTPSVGTITGAGNFSPLFNTGVSGSSITFTALNAAANTVFGNHTGGSAAPTFGKVVLADQATNTANYIQGWDGSGNPTALPPDTLFVKNRVSGTGVQIGNISSDTLYLNNFKNGYAFNYVKNNDSSITGNVDSAALALYFLRRKDSTIYATVYQNSLKQNLVTLTTTGSSGAATFNQSTGALNIPIYGGGGADSAVLNGFGIAKSVSTTNITVSVDTTLSYYLISPVTGLNNKVVADGNSNSVGINNGGLLQAYPRVSWRELDSTLASYTYFNGGVSGQTTQQMTTNAPTVIDTSFDGTKTKNYLYAWEIENDAAINTGLSSLQLQTNMNTYYTSRNAVGWKTIGATGLPRTALTGTDSLLKARIDSANLALVNSHTSLYLIDFRGNPWLNNNRSRAGFGSDWIHMNASGTLTMADSFTNVVKRDQGQLVTKPLRYTSWGGNYVDRNMVIGPLNAFGVSLLANGSPVFDVTQFNKIAMIGNPIAEAANAPNIGFDLRPNFYNPNNYTGVINADLRINQESQWINSNNNNYKVAFFNPGSNVQNMGFGIDIFANLVPGQSAVFFNTAFGGRLLQASGIGSFNTMIGSAASDTHITSGNCFVQAGLTIGTIGANNTWIGSQGTISNNVTNTITVGYGNTTSVNAGINIGTANSLTGVSTNTGGSIIIGRNNTDAGFRSIIIANNEANNYGTAPTADGQVIIGDIYNAAGYKAMRYFTLAGNQALNSTIQAAFSPITLTVAGIQAGGANTNLSAKGNEFRIYGSVATGNATGGEIVFGTSAKGASGTARESIVNVLRIDTAQNVDIGEPTTRNFGLNVNRSISWNKDSIPHVSSTTAMESIVIDTTGGGQVQLKRITIPTGTNIYNTDGTLTADRSMNGANHALNLGVTGAGNGISNFTVYADIVTFRNTGVTGRINLDGSVLYSNTATTTDANYTILDGNRDTWLDVASLTANRTVTLGDPTVAAQGGRDITLQNSNTAAFHWSTSRAIYLSTSDSLTSLANGANYNINSDGSKWLLKSVSPGIGLVVESSAGTLTLATATDYIFNGTTSTFTLPSLNANQGRIYRIKNAGSGNLTISRSGTDNIYDASSVTTITIAAGSFRIISAGPSFWYAY